MGGIAADRAIVVGGSLAGLLAARVLAAHGTQVRVLDRDPLTGSSDGRRGTPHARHIHTLLPRGRLILEELFPGLTEELQRGGAVPGDLLGGAALHLSGVRLQRARSGLLALSMSRSLLEDHVRARVGHLDHVTFGSPTDVLGLTAGDDGRVTGVRVLRRADGSAEEVLPADVVIDATGRGSRAPAWLEALGFVVPDEDRLTVDLGYATAIHRLPDDLLGGDWGTLIGATPEQPRGGAFARLEGGRWMLTLFGFLGDHPPTDPAGFRAFARSLRFPTISDAVGDAEPEEGPVAYRFAASLRRRYERVRALPDGFVPIGDSLCSLNPIYGQGMTTAALQAIVLRDHLENHDAIDTRRLVRGFARAVDAPWGMVVGADRSIPGVGERRPVAERAITSYLVRLHRAAASDPRLAVGFVRVMSMVDGPGRLLAPRMVVRVLRRGRRPDTLGGSDRAGDLRPSMADTDR